jgi:hypothetical protein
MGSGWDVGADLVSPASREAIMIMTVRKSIDLRTVELLAGEKAQ